MHRRWLSSGPRVFGRNPAFTFIGATNALITHIRKSNPSTAEAQPHAIRRQPLIMLTTNWLSSLKRLFALPQEWNTRQARIAEGIEQIKVNQGRMLAAQNERRTQGELRDHEFTIFSQWGEDGIIQHLIRSIEIKNRTFIEFGVEDFSEANCRFLLMKDNWQGFVIDSSKKNIQTLQHTNLYWKHDLQSVQAFITRENINELLTRSGFDQDLGILSIDIDGNDYHVLDAINAMRPRILICEYNAVFGPLRKISVPYQPDFNRTKAHESNLYFGASLAALTKLTSDRGYTLVGTNSAGCNAFFVRNDCVAGSLPRPTAAEAFVESRFRESRDARGQLTHTRDAQRIELIKGMPVVNVETKEIELL